MASEKIKTKSIFDFLNCLFVSKTKWEDLSESDKKAFSPYMINRFISMHPDFVGVINYLQQYTISGMNSREVYKLYLDFLPKQKFFSKYIKSNAEKDGKISDELVTFIARQEQWSTDESYTNLQFILESKGGVELIKSYLKMYGIDEKESSKKYNIK